MYSSNLREKILAWILLGPVDRLGGLVVIAPARRAGDPGSNPGPRENFSLIPSHRLIKVYILYLLNIRI